MKKTVAFLAPAVILFCLASVASQQRGTAATAGAQRGAGTQGVAQAAAAGTAGNIAGGQAQVVVEPGPGYPGRPTIISPAFPNFGALPLKYAPNAAKFVTLNAISPPLAWTAAPMGTVSITLTVSDMESSYGGDPDDLLIWAVINLPANTRFLSEAINRGPTPMLPDGAFQRSFMSNGYIGPQPGANASSHHYIFELYMLDTMLDLPRDVTLRQLQNAMKGHLKGSRGWLVATCCTMSK
jgi:Raf kinase inhibitor-like YbhB/YbcL family protein